MSKPPIFIVGAPRSGTTILRLMLDSHHNIAAGPETHFLQDFAKGAERYERCYEAYGHDRTYWAERTRDFVGRFHMDYAARKGKGRWCNKTPHYVFRLDFIREAFPDVQVVHIIRDGRAVVLSHFQRWGLRSALRATKNWRRSIEAAQKFGAKWPDQYHELRYERLVEDAAQELRRVVDFLGEPWDDAMLKPYEFSHDRTSAAHGRKSWTEGPKPKQIAEAEGVSGVYTKRLAAGAELNPLLRYILYRRSGRLMRELQYL